MLIVNEEPTMIPGIVSGEPPDQLQGADAMKPHRPDQLACRRWRFCRSKAFIKSATKFGTASFRLSQRAIAAGGTLRCCASVCGDI